MRQSWASFAAVLFCVVLALTGCTPGAAPPSSASTSAPPGGSSSTTTTTSTLPLPVALAGTSVSGEAFLGAVNRVPVVAIPPGQTTAPLPLPGQPGYLSVEQLAFRQFGSGPDLLLIMGQDGSMAWWEPSLLSTLAAHYRVTEFDFPGVGYSAPALVPMTLDWLADETAGLIQALGLVQPTVLGWGLGGEVALALAERHPASERSLVLVDSSAGGPEAKRPDASVSALLGSPTATAASLAETFFAGSSAPPLSSSPNSSSPPSALSGTAAAEAAWLDGVESTVPDDVTRTALVDERALQLGLWSSMALADATGSVVVPTLVVSGSDDSVFPAPDGLLLHRSIAGSERVELPDAGYASMFEDTAQFVASLEQFTG
ncbi:MAG TPA: alpha/beta hydrolase [Acidimicrobiales bacterium]|nr:alpha/beta hydrolase [Acidimicrobiales bacterium]